MAKLAVWLLLLAAIAAHALPRALPRFVVDLDEAPEERWKDVILYYKQMGVLEAMARWNPAGPHMSHGDEQAWLEAVRPLVDDEIMGEIDGWVKYAGDVNVTRDSMILSQFAYEQNSPAFCSGILAAMPNGTVVHGRNMDYNLMIMVNGRPLGWPDITVEVTFIRGGRPLMTSVTWPGLLGFHTAMRLDGGWTFEQQTRRLGDDMRLNLGAARRGGQGFLLLARRTMERVPDFEAALRALWTANVMSPQYFVMAGPGPYQGAVLTMDRGGRHEPDSPPLLRLSEKKNRWHLVQTNDDHFHPPADYRRPLQERKLSAAVQTEVSTEWMTEQMRGFPLNDPATVFSWVAVPGTGYYQTILPTSPRKGMIAVEMPSAKQ